MTSPVVFYVNHLLRLLHKTQFLEHIHELQYLKLYILCLAKWNDSSLGRDNFGFLEESHILATLEEAAAKIPEWNHPEFLPVVSELLQKVEQFKPKIKENCLNFLYYLFKCHFSNDELPEFMCAISASLHNLLDLKVDMMLDVKMQIESLEKNLDLFKELFEFASTLCRSHDDLEGFKIHIQACACRAACLSLLYWVLDLKKENRAPRMDVILCDLQKQISPSTPEVTRTYLAVLKASKPPAEDRLTASKLVLKFVAFLKNNFQVDPEKDDIQMLFSDLIFLITFLMDQPKTEKPSEEQLILTKADGVVNEVTSLISSLISGEIKEGAAEERNFLLHNFLQKAGAIKTEVRKIYAHLFPDSSSFNFPRINVLEFIDSLLEDLKEFCFHFPKHQIMMLQEELLSLKETNLRDFSLLEMENKHRDIKDLWTQIVNVAYSAERTVSSFIYMKKSLWHDILCLADVIEEVKLIKGEVKRIHDRHMHHILAFNSEWNSNHLHPLQANIPTVGKLVGFKDEVQKILGRLTSGLPELDIISIIGMPGSGKTFLAKIVYSDASVKLRFNKRAWCTVSQTINNRRMLLDIVSHLGVGDDNELSKLQEEDLAQIVYKSLKWQRYLIVLDDIWDVSAWNVLKTSFPEDYNGSKIIFTSQIQVVASEAKLGCTHVPLNPLPKEESWELLEMKLFDQGSCPPDFVDIGKKMATQSKGLPLIVILIAGLLRENIQSLDWWKQVGENLDSLIAKEGCTEILELSYKHLPEFLKPCFLYFGLFPEDKEIKVKELIQLWISERIIQRHEMKSFEAVAEDYLMDLVDRSLVIVTKRSSTGRIKACQVHDLLHAFCLAKGEAEKIFKVVRMDAIPRGSRYDHYRMCISEPECWISFLEHGSPAPFVNSVLSFHRYDIFPRQLELQLICNFICRFKFLRVLVLSVYLQLDTFPKGVTELILLRSLVLWGDFNDIPSSIKRLENLEILALYSVIQPSTRGYQFVLPLTTWEMQKLREIRISKGIIPWGFCHDTPPLENVQVFSGIVFPQGERLEMFLRKIPKVKKLKVLFENLDDFYDPNQPLKMDFLSCLESLHAIHSSEAGFKLRGSAFLLPSTLKKLSFQYFRLPWSEISSISKLPNLEVLKLFWGSCGKFWNVEDDEFLKLKFLKIEWIDIENLNASNESFRCLECLVVKNCYIFEEIPSRFVNISTLKMIQVENCRSTLNNSVRVIREEQVELGNEYLEVLIS